ncbi:phage gene 29 protein family protein [Nocardia brasiliensis]|uniref:phage gene 29 protein family protein n=1 Tax=Nocardia brasiliensis TaxID=37326 RepID=UPI002453E9C2|nr:DUF2744 domain-containing protein [Nocardia brasiliensis]
MGKSHKSGKIDQRPRLKPGDFPTKERCSPDCPEEAFLWMFGGLPGMKGAPLPFPVEYLKQVSRRLWDCGARPLGSKVPAEQKIKYQQPRNTDPHWLVSPGVWEDIDAPDRSKFDIKEFVQSLPQDAKRQLAEALGFDPTTAVPSDQDIVSGITEQKQPKYGKPSRDGASVSNIPVRDPGWNPCLHTVDEVLEYLEAVDDDERDRVLSVERYLSKKPRATILKKYPGVGV